MKRTAAMIVILLGLQFWPALIAGTIHCSATCLSKLASAVSIAANGKAIVGGAKKVRKVVRVKKAKKT